jgi:hypothetical protein
MPAMAVPAAARNARAGTRLSLSAIPKQVLPADQMKTEMPMLPLVLSFDSHLFEPPDLWQTRIDRAFRDRAPRIERIDGGDQIVVEADQILSGIGLISNAGAWFERPFPPRVAS